MARRRGLRRFPEVRRALQGLPVAAQNELLAEFEKIGAKIAAEQRLRAPKKSHALEKAIDHKVFPRALRLEIGLRNLKKGRADLFYGRIQDLGRRAQTVIVQRLVKGGRAKWVSRIATGQARARVKPRDLVASYSLRVRAMQGKKFVTGKFTDLRTEARSSLQGIYARAQGKVG